MPLNKDKVLALYPTYRVTAELNGYVESTRIDIKSFNL